ncbi:uncharacterized protein ACHE_80276S [Aspergillus chevalieri]|uniref:Uncharacterized protein n=1 Tax=Aspergillus chevalieri TaxID=182096 RepID=A0A7R7ZT06_ASPCH|nr:uncharacterized protein ACHE_80276S [Aspergillus chevalieri]BCR92376.1 hypothetical protein ACHE_80276S [Aspergillus chevalieri]
MPSSTEERLSAQLDEDITNGDFHSVKDFYESADPEKQSSLLTGIAERAAAKARVDILHCICAQFGYYSLGLM